MAADGDRVRAVRLLGVVALVTVVLGALGAGLATAWAVTRGGPAARPTVTRTDAPVGLGSDVAPRLRAAIEAVEPGSLDRRVVVENPNARPVAGVRVTVTLDGGTCRWVDGPFPAPFGLAPAANTSRTCNLQPDPSATATSIEVVVELGRDRVATASDLVARPAPPPPPIEGPTSTAAPTSRPPVPSTPPTTEPTGQPSTSPTPVPCPRLVHDAQLAATASLDGLGPAMADRVGLVDAGSCPDWAELGGLRVVRGDDAGGCPTWALHLDADPRPLAQLTGRPEPGCPAVPLQVEVLDQPTDRAALVAALAAWAVEGPSTRAPELVRAAATGTGLACAGPGSVALGQAYEQHAGGHRIYRVTIGPC